MLFVFLSGIIFITTHCEKDNPETETNSEQFLGTWIGTDNCSGNSNITFTISKGKDDKTLIISNLFGKLYSVSANVEKNAITIPEYKYGSYSLHGNGSIKNDTLTLGYTLNDASVTNFGYTCSIKATHP